MIFIVEFLFGSESYRSTNTNCCLFINFLISINVQIRKNGVNSQIRVVLLRMHAENRYADLGLHRFGKRFCFIFIISKSRKNISRYNVSANFVGKGSKSNQCLEGFLRAMAMAMHLTCSGQSPKTKKTCKGRFFPTAYS